MAKLEGVKTLDMVNGEITKVAYGGAAYERVGNVGEHGDIALRIAKPASFAEVGQFYPVFKEFEILRFIDDEGEKPSVQADRFVFFRKVDAGTNPSVEDRVAKAEGEIESLKSDVAALKGEAEYKRISVDEAQPGDYVKFDYPPSFLTAKEYYEIKEFEDGDPVIIDDDGDEYDTYSDDFEVYRKPGAASVEAEPKPERLKVGDYAKVVEDQTTSDNDPISDESCVGDYVEVLTDDKSEIPFEVRIITGKQVGETAWAREFALVRATDEEVAEAKRAAAERKKWAEIGREVGEYKTGDVVQLSDHNRKLGVMDYIGVHFYGVELSTGDYVRPDKDRVTLVTPVEARFDR
ncbi:hypothetical protein OKW88_21235 [Bacillus subtilis]|uniref:hypothetical protein n=1 Tax=Bacillus subtilis TaxID=1423 RepID=UPI0038926FC2